MKISWIFISQQSLRFTIHVKRFRLVELIEKIQSSRNAFQTVKLFNKEREN